MSFSPSSLVLQKETQSCRASLGLTRAPDYFCFQKLDVSRNKLRSLPTELSSLRNLKELLLTRNDFPEPPVSVLRGMTAITKIDLTYQCRWLDVDVPGFKVPSPLLPILHPGLVKLDLRQSPGSWDPFEWDPISVFHLGRALVEVSDRRPIPTLLLGKL